MRSQATTTELVSFSTRGLPRRERKEALRNLQQRGIMTVEPLADHVPRAAIRKRFLPGADILSGMLSGLRQFGTQHGGDNLFLALNVGGVSAARERDREVTLRGGDALLFSGPAEDARSTALRPCFSPRCASRIGRWRHS
jgi:hypothetical protein